MTVPATFTARLVEFNTSHPGWTASLTIMPTLPMTLIVSIEKIYGDFVCQFVCLPTDSEIAFAEQLADTYTMGLMAFLQRQGAVVGPPASQRGCCNVQ
jgi:hypothetical protein